MPKTKSLKKSTIKVAKKSPVKKVTKRVSPKVVHIASKKRTPLFRLGILLVLIFLALSVYQAFAKGTGPLSFLASKSDVFVVTDDGPGGGVATCNLPESVCKTVNGCTWTAPIYSEKKVECSDTECKKGKAGCNGKDIKSYKTVEVCEDDMYNLSKCKQLGFDTVKTSVPVTTYSCTGSYMEDVLERAGGCSGTPIAPPVASLPPVNTQVDSPNPVVTTPVVTTPAVTPPTVTNYSGNRVVSIPKVCENNCKNLESAECKSCLTVHGTALCCKQDSREVAIAAGCTPNALGILKAPSKYKGMTCPPNQYNCSGIYSPKGGFLAGKTQKDACVEQAIGTGGGTDLLIDPQIACDQAFPDLNVEAYNRTDACTVNRPIDKGLVATGGWDKPSWSYGFRRTKVRCCAAPVENKIKTDEDCRKEQPYFNEGGNFLNNFSFGDDMSCVVESDGGNEKCFVDMGYPDNVQQLPLAKSCSGTKEGTISTVPTAEDGWCCVKRK